MSEKEMREIGEYLNTQYIVARNVDKTDKLSKETTYIQHLFDQYLDLKIQSNKIQQEKQELIEWLEIKLVNSDDVTSFAGRKSLNQVLGERNLIREILNKIKESESK